MGMVRPALRAYLATSGADLSTTSRPAESRADPVNSLPRTCRCRDRIYAGAAELAALVTGGTGDDDFIRATVNRRAQIRRPDGSAGRTDPAVARRSL